MKSLLLTSAILLAVAFSAAAAAEADDCPPAPPPVVVAEAPSCPPPPPLDEALSCPPLPAMTEESASAGRLAVSEPQYRLVTVKKRVWEEEAYIVNETRTEVVEELRTRPAKINSPRLARYVEPNRPATLVVHKKDPYDVAYMHPVKVSTTVPVMKTKKVSRIVEEGKIVPDRNFFGR